MAVVQGGPGGILSYFTRHRTAANLLLVLLLAFGIGSALQIRAQFFPDVLIEQVSVTVRWDGAGAEDVDKGIVALIEPVLLGVEGIEGVNSAARAGGARIVLSFEPGTDMARAEENVRTAVSATGNLPEGAEDPTVARSVWRDRVTDVVIHGPTSVEQLGRHADEFVARLYQRGVTRTSIRGFEADVIRVSVPESVLVGQSLTLAEVASSISRGMSARPSGDVGAGARVRSGVERRSADEIAAIAVQSGRDGGKLLVSDLGMITIEGPERGETHFVGDNPAVIISVDRNAAGDAIRMQTIVEQVAQEMAEILPASITIELAGTRSELITARLSLLLDNALLGLALVLGLLFLFLSARTAFWVALGIPVAMLTAIGLMHVAGLTLNMISLFALIICLGIVVDDAIVVGEHADFRARRLGESPVVAAENAARRMSVLVLASSITTILAFLALTVIGGRFGSLIFDIPFTVSMVLLASLVECFLILPNHMSHALKGQARQRWYDKPSHYFNIGFRWVRDRLFRPLVALCMRLRYVVVAGALALLLGSVSLVLSGQVTWRFFDAPEQGSITGNFAMLPGAGRAESLEMMRELQRAVAAVGARYQDEYGQYPVRHVRGVVGAGGGRGLSGTDAKDADQLGAITMELIDADLRPYSSFAFLADLQAEVQPHPQLETLSFRGMRFGPGGDALSVRLYGAEPRVLKQAAEALIAAMAAFPAVSGLEDSLAYDKSELAVSLTPLGEALGLSTEQIGAQLSERLSGIEAASFPQGARTARVIVALPAAEQTADILYRTMIRLPQGGHVQLADVVTITQSDGFSTISREDGRPVVTVSGDISDDDPEAANAVQTQLQDRILPEIAARHGVDWELSGLAAQEREFLSDALLGFALCMLGIYLTLAWILASWARPLVVLLTVPFGLIGAIWGHYVWQVPLSMFSVVGLIGMAGIIINDTIVLLSTADEYARRRALLPAMIEAAADRLRAVVLTTLTTVLGLSPLLYERSSDAQFLKPTVITLAYGLGFGMVLVLILVPAMVMIGRDFSRLFTALRRGLSGGVTGGSGRGAGRGLVGGQRAVFLAAVAAVLGAAVLTLGQVAAGVPLSPLLGALSGLLPPGLSPVVQAVAVHLGLSTVAVLLALVLAVLVGRRGGRQGRAQPMQ